MNFPSGHTSQELAAVALFLPLGQLSHTDAPSPENCPALQSVHVLDPAGADVPAVHRKQVFEPVIDASLPARHASQELDPLRFW